MPEPDSDRRRANGTRGATRGDIGRDTKTRIEAFPEDTAVNDRIRRWQVQNVEEAGDLDTLSVRSRPWSEAFRTPDLSRASSPITKEPQTTPRKRSTKWVQQDNRQWTKQRRSMRHSQGTSDLWKADQTNAHSEMQHIPVQEDSQLAASARGDSTHARNVTSSRAEREERRRRRREARTRASGDTRSRHNQRSKSDVLSKHSNERHDDDQYRDRHTTDPIEPEVFDTQRLATPDDSPQFSRRDPIREGSDYSELNNDGMHTYQPTKYAQTLGQGINPESIQLPKGRKLTILNKTMGILGGRNDAPPPESNRIPSIQAWLEEQPGLSLGRADPVAPPVNDDTQNLKKHSRRKKVSIEPTATEVDDPNKIWESIAATKEQKSDKNSKARQSDARSETSPSKRRLFSFEVSDGPSKGGESTPLPPAEQTEQDVQSPAQLHRRVAKSKRSKSYSIPAGVTSPALPEKEQSPLRHRNNRAPRETSRQEAKVDNTSRVTESVEAVEAEVAAQTRVEQSQAAALKRKITHEDLISILSQPRLRKSTKSVRSVRRAQDPSQESVLPALLEAMRNEEPKYYQELRTLVDGVTPVLLQSLLSKTDAQATLGLFTHDDTHDVSLMKPIIQMGIALERLKALHGRIPLAEDEIDNFLSWASSAQKHYQDYIKWYRLGFHGILVNLAPLGTPRAAEEQLLARDLDGDATDADGQKVDVAYLQKRPLVKLKKISKLVSAIRDEHSTGEKASKLADVYVDLTEKARQRYSEEQGRLEDEAAANIDVTRTRDIRTMAPITSAQIDKCRKVRARDCFEMTLNHSTGQRMDCRIEIIIRDDPQPGGIGGDILICQIEEKAKWLLFAPVSLSNVSARRDESTLDIVLMVRGTVGITENWYELFALKADVPEAVVEWVQMLGSSPLPPKVCQAPRIIQSQTAERPPSEEVKPAVPPKVSHVRLSRAALANLPSDIDVPIGEPSVVDYPTNKQGKANSASAKPKPATSASPKLNLGGGLQKREIPDLSLRMKAAATSEKYNQLPTSAQAPPTRSGRSEGSPTRPSETSNLLDASLPRHGPKRDTGPLLPRSPAERSHQSSTMVDHPQAPNVSWPTTSSRTSQLGSPQQSQVSSLREERRRSKVSVNSSSLDSRQPSETSGHSIRDSKFMSMDSNAILREQRKSRTTDSRNSTPTESKASTSLTESIREQWAALSATSAKQHGPILQTDKAGTNVDLVTENYPIPHVRQPRNTQRQQDIPSEEELPPPPPPPHRQSLRQPVYSCAPAQASVPLGRSGNEMQPRPMSELRQEYHSSSSGSVTDSDDDDDTSDTSEEDYGSEVKDQATPLVTMAQGSRRNSQVPSRALPSPPTAGSRTLQPSDSASNSPYRRAPSPSAYPAEKKRRCVAMVCSWSDRGVWQPVQDEECSIVISPGLVQAFKMTAAHSQPMTGANWEDQSPTPTDGPPPLVEFELTPIVPLRKGTALDITIRSPPTARSTVQTTNNVMFRSKTTQDCEKLYQLINWARCNNPTYAQLVRSRAREGPLTFNPEAAATKTRSWFSLGSQQRSSYRASSQPPPSMADTGTSGTSAFSAFAALKRFGKNSPFSLKRSSVIRRSGVSVTGESLYSSSNGTGSGSGTSTPSPSQAGFVPGPDGPNVPATSAEAVGGGGMVNNMKIHLFLRQAQKWEQLGQCHLTVLPALQTSQGAETLANSGSSTPVTSQPPPSATATGPSAMSNARTRHYRLPSSSHTPHKIHGDGREKRILITSVKNKEIVLLDETLSETCFEKIMQTGIAINVWKEDEAVQDRGGVLTGRSRTYMVQFKTSMEASWVFNMCGVYRYGAA